MSQLSLGITTAVIYIIIQIYNFVVLLDKTSETNVEIDTFNENIVNDVYITRFLRTAGPWRYAPSVSQASYFSGNKGLNSFGASKSNGKALTKIAWFLGMFSKCPNNLFFLFKLSSYMDVVKYIIVIIRMRIMIMT
jgi:hypothetical protein